LQNGGKDKDDDEKRPAAFKAFQRQWLAVYLVTMLADWLQGTHMYTLYTSYNQPAGALFGIGFTSSAVFGTFLGLLVDKYGRRLGCIMFCVLELVINILEHVNDFHLLALGRVLGGLSTSLLFTSFESWMVSEHRRRGFKEEWIAETFAIAQMGNGFMAVLAGVLAQMVADAFGDIGPFQLAILLTVIALVLVFTWEENYGGDKSDEGKRSGQGNIFYDSLKCIKNDHKVLLLGLIQSFFEGAMYTFVIMWVPTLALMVPGGKPGVQDWEKFSPGQGWIFSAMMISISIGGELFAGMLKVICFVFHVTGSSRYLHLRYSCARQHRWTNVFLSSMPYSCVVASSLVLFFFICIRGSRHESIHMHTANKRDTVLRRQAKARSMLSSF
jgi:MFS family permease